MAHNICRLDSPSVTIVKVGLPIPGVRTQGLPGRRVKGLEDGEANRTGNVVFVEVGFGCKMLLVSGPTICCNLRESRLPYSEGGSP